MNDNLPVWRRVQFRLLGVIPLIFFLSRFIEYFRVGTPSHIQWCCHISNLLLAVGMFLASPLLMRIAVTWLILGLPPWIVDMIYIRIITPVSVLSHLGGFLMALFVVRKVGTKMWGWIPALIFFLLLQQLSRFTTPAELNVNVAHYAYGPWKDVFSNYWKYWLVNTALVAATVWVIELVLLKLFPQIRAHKSGNDE